MNCVWFGGDNSAPSNAAVQYNSVVPCFDSSWIANENRKQAPVSEDITLTEFRVYLNTAPGIGTSYTFTIRDDLADTVASVTISGASTSGTWTGSLSVAAGSLLAVSATPVGTPTAPTFQHFQVFYTTNGQHFLMPAVTGVTAPNTAVNYQTPLGGNGSSWSTVVTDFEIVVPTDATITKLYASVNDGTIGATAQYNVSVRLNNTSDNLTVSLTDSNLTGSTTGSVDIAPGDTLVIKESPVNTPTLRRLSYCMTIAPDINGEMIYGYGSPDSPANAATEFENMLSIGATTWNGTESNRYNFPPAVDFKKLYVKLATAPGGIATRTFTLMDNGSPTALSATISGAATTGNDTVNTVAHTGNGNTGTFRSTVANTPAATAGVHTGYVIFITQPNDFLYPKIIIA